MNSSAISHQFASPLHTPDWFAIRLMAPEPAAARLGAVLRALDTIEEQSFAVRGEAMLLIEERDLYRYVIDEEVGDYYQSFDKWLKDTLPRSWGYCRDALRARKELKEIPFDAFGKMKRCNIEKLKEVSSSLRLLPEVIEAAKNLPEKQFVEKMNRDHAQHLEVKRPVMMVASPDAAKFDHAVEMVMAVEECNRDEALIHIAELIEQEYAAPFEHLSDPKKATA
jgi:hypothetical protein